VIKKANTMCTVGEWNLSGEVLTSRKAQSALHEYLKIDKTLREEIESKLGTLFESVLSQQPDPDLDEIKHEIDIDDTSVPASAVIQQALGINISDADIDGITDVQQYCAKENSIRTDGTGRLQGGGPSEDIWELTEDDLGTENT
jgi:hypothetical protein